MGAEVESGGWPLVALSGLRRRRREEVCEASRQQTDKEDLAGEEDGGRRGVFRGEF